MCLIGNKEKPNPTILQVPCGQRRNVRGGIVNIQKNWAREKELAKVVLRGI
jgi:hypothetical protein